MLPFSYASAADVTEAQRLVAKEPDGMFIAGGTDVLQLLQDSVIAPRRLIDINALPLRGIEVDADGARIGALTRLAEVAEHDMIRSRWPLLAEALLETASPQVRNMASVGGNLLQRTRCLYFRDATVPCNKRSPGSGCPAIDGLNRMNAILGTSEHCIAAYPGDMAIALLALDAELELLGPNGARRIMLGDLHRLPDETPDVETALAPGELIAAVMLPANSATTHSHYLKLRDRASFEWALVSVAVVLAIDAGTVRQARVAAGGVGTRPWRLQHVEQLLLGRSLDAQSASKAGNAAADGATPRPGNAFKVPMLRRAVERALLTAGGVA
jgi:xanthine dehydrogenase YagS FAD-binding subunit